MSHFRKCEAKLYQDLEEQTSVDQRTKKSRTLYGTIFVAMIIGVVMLYTAPPNAPAMDSVSNLRAKATMKFSKNSNSINYSLKREGYSALDYFDKSYGSHLKYTLLSDFQAVIEPYQSMELAMYDLDDGLADNSVSYEAIICPVTDSTQDCQTVKMYYDSSSKSTVTTTLSFECSAYDTFSMTLFTLDKDGTVTNQVTNKALCMYVRREIRDYSKADLDRFLDVMHVLSNTTLSEGQEKYGSDFYDVKTLAKLHYWNAAQRDADHIHEGTGFLTQHLKLTNLFEISIQTVDPSLVVPYWDFTIDNQTGWKIFNSFVSSPDVFGTVSYPKSSIKGFGRESDKVEDARIPDGRWANQLVEMNTEFPSLKTGYGYLRAPWVLNPSPYTSRYSFDWDVDFGYLPSCYYNYDILEYTEMMTYFYEMAYGPHGTAHTTYGGVFGCDAIDDWVTQGILASVEDQQYICSRMGNLIKEFYRHGFVSPESDCTVNTEDYTSSVCRHVCNLEYSNIAATTFYLQLGDYFATDNSTELKTFLKGFICSDSFSKFFVGDHYESSSMTDPSFWVMHPTIERLTHAKLMSGGFDDETWSTDPVNDFVCSKSSCYDEELDETDYFEDCCYGHYEYDQMYNGFKGTRDDYFGMTNHDSLASTDPRNASYSVPYIYDDFVYDHCAKTDYDVDGLLTTLYQESLDSNGKPGNRARKMPASERKTLKKMRAVVDANRKSVELSISRKLAKKAKDEEEAKKTGVKHVAHTPKKVRKVVANSPSNLIK